MLLGVEVIMPPATANKVADYLLWYSGKHGDLLTNKKIQKLVYYSQAWYLALYNEPLFAKPIEAWIFGPVVRSLYNRFKHYKWDSIPPPVKKPTLTQKAASHIEEVYRVYGALPAFQLERLTHLEDPWINARKGFAPDEPCNNIIKLTDMKRYYRREAKEVNGKKEG